ncbi:MAG: acetolactate synthase large subunit [Planctomycetota bacterium]|jgi:acetolactate synthase-1/2/3 large subunit
MKASDLFVHCLEEEGVEYMFGVPGEENADIMISLLDSSIRFIVCRHEQAAAFMCDAYGRLTGKPTCCLGTLGPGATNLITGVADANMDRAPCVVLTGQAATTRLHKESHQAMDLVELFAPAVKWGTSVQHPDSIPEIVRKAFRLACTDKFGATHIDLPENIAHMETLAQPITSARAQRSAPNPNAVAQAADVIRNAQFPVLLTGNGTLRNQASAELRAFARQNGIPVVNTFMGKGAFPASDQLSLFTVGLSARDYPDVVIERADCVVSVGFDMVEYHPRTWNRGNKKQIVHVDMSPAEIDENYRTAAEIVGDIRLALGALRKATAGMRTPDASLYQAEREAMLRDFAEYEDDEGFPVKPQRILCDVRKYLDEKDLVLSDVGAHKMWIARNLQTNEPNTILIPNGFCSMGFALPGAIGAKIAHPGRRVLAICGDGGVMMNIQDLETAVREQLPIVVMVWTDGEFGLIKWKQTASFGKHSHISFTNPDWMKLAEAFGMAGFAVDRAGDLPGALESAFSAGRPALIEVPVDYSENMKLTERLGAIPLGELCGCLEHVNLVRGLAEPVRRVIAESMGDATFEKGETVFAEGDPGDTVYIVSSGSASIRQGGKEIARVGVGGEFGEMAALSDEPRVATVVAAEDLVCGTIEGEHFRELIRAEPDALLHIARLFAKRMAGRKG